MISYQCEVIYMLTKDGGASYRWTDSKSKKVSVTNLPSPGDGSFMRGIVAQNQYNLCAIGSDATLFSSPR